MPGIIGDIRSLGRIWGAAVDPGRGEEPLHTLDVTGRGTSARVHVTATNEPCARRHADLVTCAVVADHGANGVSAMRIIITRLRRIVPAGVPHAVVNGIVPVVIMIGVLSVPAAVVWFKRVMCPTNSSISASNDNALPCKSKVPHVRRMRVLNPGLDA